MPRSQVISSQKQVHSQYKEHGYSYPESPNNHKSGYVESERSDKVRIESNMSSNVLLAKNQ